MSKFFDISLPEIRTVWYNVGMSRVDVKISARPNGIMSGIHPAIASHEQAAPAAEQVDTYPLRIP